MNESKVDLLTGCLIGLIFGFIMTITLVLPYSKQDTSQVLRDTLLSIKACNQYNETPEYHTNSGTVGCTNNLKLRYK